MNLFDAPTTLERLRVLLVFLAFTLSAPLSAQEYRGRIQGIVSDPSHSAVPNASLTLTNTATNVAAMAHTDGGGRYLFDVVEPGTYTLFIEASGFTPFREETVVIRQRGDVTIDASLQVGTVSGQVTVVSQSAQIQFNSGKLDTTIDKQIAENLPQIIRNPFFLSKVDPSDVQSETRLESQPYHSTGTGTQQVGGINGMDLQVDGVPVGLGTATGYVPSPDMVQEVNVQVNALDAEFGQSTGSAISVTLKSGTNQFHGSAFYQGIYPWANAILNRVSRIPNVQRNHIYGGTLGHPIVRNRLFNFVAYEGWRNTDPQTLTGELPTALERKGDYSQSLNGAGGLRVIYDPYSTKTSADGATITRTAFPANVIPPSRLSSVALAYSAALPQPNLPGVGNYHVRNYVVPLALHTPYKNFTDRADYIINDRWRDSGRVSIIRTPISADNPTGSDLAWMSDRGSARHSQQYTNELTWVKSPNTVVSGSVAIFGYTDDAAPVTKFAGYDSLWPGQTWYKNIFANGALLPQVSPGMIITTADGNSVLSAYSNGIGTNGPLYKKHPWQDFVSLKATHNRGKHYLKNGIEIRGERVNQLPQLSFPNFTFNATSTANTYVNADTRLTGDGYASFLVGAISGGSIPERTATNLFSRSYALYFNDDYKIFRRLTLNLGLRWEYEIPYEEIENRAARGVDLTKPNPDLQAANLQMPAALRQIYNGNWILNGAYQWTTSSNPGQWNSSYGTFSPRVGIAYRWNDETSLRVGWGRYWTPWLNSGTITQGNFYGFSLDNAVPGPVQGIPQMNLDSPYPSSFPLPALPGKTLGANTGLGDNLSWISASRPRQHLDRVNASVQRQLPWGMVVDATFFINYFNALVARNINQVDPNLAYNYKAATNVSVPNPFYQILTPNRFPGPLRNQPTVSVNSLAVPYPQYGSLNVTDYDNTGGTHFRQFSLRLRKNATHGVTFLAGYSFTFSDILVYYDDIATYQQNRTWQQDPQPRYRITFGGNWELPVGHSRQFLSRAPRFVDALIGGWNLSPLITYHTGNFVQFPALLVNGDVAVKDPGPNSWFNAAAFSRLPAYTPRANPVIYPGVTGPVFFNLDTSLTKSIRITERVSGQLRMDSFNTLNKLTWNDPVTNITSTFFGKSSDQFNLNGVGVGRQTQLGLRIIF